MKKVTYFSFFILSFLFFNIMDTNSVDNYALLYDKNDLYSESYHTISFNELNIREIDTIFANLDIKIINIKPAPNMYFKDTISYKSTNQVIDEYINKIKLLTDEYIYYELNGFNIESIRVLCTNKELMKLEMRIEII